MTPTIAVHATQPLGRLALALRSITRHGVSYRQVDYALARLHTPYEAHLIWGMNHDPETYEALAKRGNVYFAENGWFPQKEYFYIDRYGPSAMSSLCNTPQSAPLSGTQEAWVQEQIARLHERLRVVPRMEEGDYILVPLQKESDTQVLYWSGCCAPYPDRQSWFVEQVCRLFPEDNIIIRPHPRDHEVIQRIQRSAPAFRAHPRAAFRTEGSSFDWAAGAKLVLGISSTVLLEALTFNKPVCALGRGIFSGSAALLECDGDFHSLALAKTYAPDLARVRSLLFRLMNHQIPYTVTADDVMKYGALEDLIDCARRVARPVENVRSLE